MTAQPYSMKWWGLVVLHNSIIHPILPIAEVLDLIPSSHTKGLAAKLYALHDATYPEGAG